MIDKPGLRYQLLRGGDGDATPSAGTASCCASGKPGAPIAGAASRGSWLCSTSHRSISPAKAKTALRFSPGARRTGSPFSFSHRTTVVTSRPRYSATSFHEFNRRFAPALPALFRSFGSIVKEAVSPFQAHDARQILCLPILACSCRLPTGTTSCYSLSQRSKWK